MATGYLTLKTVHVVAAIVFVGNLVVSALWKVLADRTREPRVIAFGQRLITVTDLAFTGPGATLVLLTGLGMTTYGYGFFRMAWMQWGLGLFLVSGVIWAAVLLPIQLKQARLAREFARGAPIPDEYWRLGRLWMAFGTVATVLPLVNVYLMVFKPS